MRRRFQQLDVFATGPYSGNPLAVVVDGDGLSAEQMQRFANWTNLSETTFLLPPTDPAADYRVRIFTASRELPFAGHPTLGSCRAWLAHGGDAAGSDTIVQECGVGLVSIRRDGDRLAFAAPDLIRSGPVDDELLAQVESVLGVDVIGAEWGDNGPGWVVAEVRSADVVVSLKPDFALAPDLKLGVVGRVVDDPSSVDFDVEVRAFYPGPDATHEDPVTGSLNAAVAQWMMGRDPALTSYVARQGSVLGRDGRVYLDRDAEGEIWVGGRTDISIEGLVDI
jgi:PhzF family phenazine biosynthesis protein